MRITTLAFALTLLGCGTAHAAKLTIYSRLDYARAVAHAFTAKTGIAVRVRRPPPTGLADRIAREGTNPQWSLAWFYGTPTAASLDARGLLARHLPVPAALTKMARDLVPEDGSAIPTGVVLGGVLLMSKTAPFAPPSRWADLIAPAYHGLVGMADPQTDDAAWGGVASLLAQDGWPGGKPFVTTLKTAGLHIYARTRDTISALRNGAIQLALVRSSAAFHAAGRVDTSLKVVIPSPAALMPAFLVMPSHLPAAERKAAESFIAFADSPAGQAVALGTNDADSDFWPVADTAVPKALPVLGTLDAKAPAAITTDTALVIAWFERDIVGSPL